MRGDAISFADREPGLSLRYRGRFYFFDILHAEQGGGRLLRAACSGSGCF
jgi:hypothetical protein